jgi:CTP synthase
MVIQFSRDVLGMVDGNSTENDANIEHPLVIGMPEHHPGQMGRRLRLGKRTTIFKSNCTLSEY